MVNDTPPDCPFCRANGLLHDNPLAETPGGFLLEAKGAPGNYLIIPSHHVEALIDLPDDWWKEFKALLAKVPITLEDYNLSLNMGKAAGQTVKHLHFWIIPRPEGEPASGKGLKVLITEVNQQ